MRNERGFALIGALWLLVAMSAIALQVSLEARLRRLAALNAVEHARAAAAATAGLETARARLERLLADRTSVQTGDRDPWWNAAAFLPDTMRLDDSGFHVAARDANAALHLNRASEDELERFFVALRVDAGEADRLAQAIADWRDPDDLHRARGAERNAYLEAGAPVLPRNGPFASVDDLLHVRGMTPHLFGRVRPYLTVAGTGRVNLNTAPRPVLLALPGLGEEAVAVLERRRGRARGVTNMQELEQALSPPARRAIAEHLTALLARATFETQELEVTSVGWGGDGRVAARATALFVRARENVFVIGTRVE